MTKTLIISILSDKNNYYYFALILIMSLMQIMTIQIKINIFI
jgi:hypothetical protein